VKNARPDRKYTAEFRAAPVRQVLDGGRSLTQVTRSPQTSHRTPATWVARAKNGLPLLKRSPVRPVDDLRAGYARLRQENARLKLEKEVLRKAAACFARRSMYTPGSSSAATPTASR